MEGDQSPLWFFTSKDNEMVKLLGSAQPATATFTAKGHDLFASLQGTVQPHDDAGVKMLLGVDPKKDAREKVATVDLR